MLYRDIALKMAIRHPRVGEILSGDVTEAMERELAMDYGLIYKAPFSFKDDGVIEFRHTAETYELWELYPIIFEKGYRFTVGFDTMMLLSNEKEMPTKLLPSKQNKGGLMIDKINFEWYDHVMIHGKSEYSLDPSRKTKDQIKKNIEILDDYIINKRWFELLSI